MGKSKNASFSCSDKPNLQLVENKLKEKSVSKKYKNNKNESASEVGKKKKKNFLSKWLTSVRGSWSSGEARQTQGGSKSLKKSLKLLQTPVDSERKASSILTNPDRTEFKTVTAEYCPSKFSEEVFPDKNPVLGNDNDEIGKDTKDETNIKEPILNQSQSLSKDSNLLKNPPQKIESLFTSALFIHKDIDRMVESAVFMEPTLPRDYAESKTSEEISQKSLIVNSDHVTYQKKEEDQEIKTFKTNSEPTWEERKKIIHQQRLKENVHYLVKQYVLLESQDMIDFSRLKTDSAERKKVSFNYKTSGSTARDLSREVSPEILVNIKPFKEYVSENISSCLGSGRSSTFNEKQDRPIKHCSKDVTENMEIVKVAKKHNCPVIKSVKFLKKNDSVLNEKNTFGIEDTILTLSPIKNNLRKNTPDSLDLETPAFSFWDLYKTHSRSKHLLQVEVELGSASFQLKPKEKEYETQENAEPEEEVLLCSKSLDEVINSLEDRDHDLIFQKNLPQFRKKISVMHRFDLRKSAFNANKKGLTKTEDKVWHKLIRLENPLEIKNPIARKCAKVTDFSLENSRKKKIEMCRSKVLDLRKEITWKSGKILENFYFVVCEKAVINQVLASRVEAKTLSFYQTLREVRNMQENNIVAIIKVENPMNIDTLMLFKKSRLLDSKASDMIGWFLCVNQRGSGPRKNFASIKVETDRCASENFLSSFKTNKNSLDFLKTRNSCQLNLCTKTSNSRYLELTEGEGNENREKITEIGLKGKMKAEDEISRTVVLILNYPSYEYTVRIFENKFGSPEVSLKSRSEPDMHKNLVNKKQHQSDSAVNNYKKEKVKSGGLGIPSGRMRPKNYSNGCFNCFHAFYNSFNDDEGTISCKSLSKTQSIYKKTNAKKGDGEAQKPKLQEKEFSEKLSQKLKCKSIALPKKIFIQNQFFQEKNRGSRSKIFLKKQYADFVHCEERKMPAEGTEGTMKEEFMLRTDGEMDKKKMFLIRKSGANVKKEVVAAINLIKDLNSYKEEAKGKYKKVSFLILLSKN